MTEGGKRELLKIQGPDQVIYSIRRERPGNYDINITAVADTYVHFLATDEDLSGLGQWEGQGVVTLMCWERKDFWTGH